MKKYIKKIMTMFLEIGCKCSWNTETPSYLLINKKSSRFCKIKKIFPNFRFEWFWYNDIEEIRTKGINDFENLFNKVDDFSKFVISKLLYFSNSYNNKNSKIVLQFAKDTTCKDYRYWTTMDISRFTFLSQKGFYPEYYNDRKKLFIQVNRELNLEIPQKKDNNNNKLCIVTHLLDKSLSNSVQRVVSMISKNIVNDFDEITIFPLDIFTPSKCEEHKLTTVLPYNASINSKQSIAELLPKKVKVCYPYGKNYKDKFQNIIDSIYNYNPSCILDMSDEYSIISYYYSRDFYTVYFPLRDTNSSMFFNTIVGAPKWKFEETNKIYNSIDICKVSEWNFPEYVPIKTNNHTRSQLGINEKDFVLISIGNNESTFTNIFVDEICSIVKKNNFVWILVGQGAPKYMHKKYGELFSSNKIIEYGYEKELYSLCSICNVNVRPNMTGGSGATAIAAMAGVPVAMTNFLCDPSRWLGVDYLSDIHNYHDLSKYIEKLYCNKQFYQYEKKKICSLINCAVDSPQKWRLLVDILKRKEKSWSNERV